MKVKYLWIILITVLTFIGCKDNTGSLGSSVMPDDDQLSVGAATYSITTRSIPADSVYARTSTAFLGKYTDKDFGTFTADFLAEFNCTDTLLFPRNRILDETIKTNISLYYDTKNGYFGDPLNPSRLSVYQLNRLIEDDPNVYYYTDINPQDYYDITQPPIGQKAYTAKDPTVTDSLWNTYDGYSIYIPLPSEEGKRIVDLAHTNPEYFENSETFKNNVFKGVYVKSDHGDGTILYIDNIIMSISADVYAVDSLGNFPIKRKAVGHTDEDSTVYTVVSQFATTKEVIQANRFQNSDILQNWIADTKHTYLKSPAGIFTEVKLPLDSIIEFHKTDTLNSARVTFTNYNKVSSDKKYDMPPPSFLLMVRKKDMHTFFEKNMLPDNITSYLASHDATNNQYVFSNIRRLVTTCINETDSIETPDEDWDKVVLIPVTRVMEESTSSSSSSTLIAIRHDLRLTSARLEGGEEGKKIDLQILFTKF